MPESTSNKDENKTANKLTNEQVANMNKFISSPLNCKLYVEKSSPNNTTTQQNVEYRKAEVLWARELNGKHDYYIHYLEFNKRLDQWVSIDKIDFTRDIEFPKPDQKKKSSNNKQPSSGASTPLHRSTPPPSELLKENRSKLIKKEKSSQQQQQDEEDKEKEDDDDDQVKKKK
ncbi:RNA binding activity-knot of a chromodomain-containing protein, partial [Cunninghamella echinulata]